MGSCGQGEGVVLWLPCLTWPELLLVHGRDSAVGSRLMEHQVSVIATFLFLGLLAVRMGKSSGPVPGLVCGNVCGRHHLTVSALGRWQNLLRTGQH